MGRLLKRTSPSPIRARVICDNGARSPLAPTDPFLEEATIDYVENLGGQVGFVINNPMFSSAGGCGGGCACGSGGGGCGGGGCGGGGQCGCGGH